MLWQQAKILVETINLCFSHNGFRGLSNGVFISFELFGKNLINYLPDSDDF